MTPKQRTRVAWLVVNADENGLAERCSCEPGIAHDEMAELEAIYPQVRWALVSVTYPWPARTRAKGK